MAKIKSIIFLVLFACSYVLYANDLTPAQKTFQNSIMTFLREEGFSPSVDEDNSLNFKKEGELYWIDIADNSPFYVEFHRSGFNCSDANMSAVILACNKSNKRTKCVKSIVNESSVSIVIEMYCHSSEEFKYIFYKSLKELDNAYNATKEYYNEFNESGNSPFSISKVEIANTDTDGSLITSWDATIYDFKTKYIKPRLTVDVNKSGTYDIFVKFITPTGMSTGSNSPSGYSYKSSVKMDSGTHTYLLSGWGGDTAGHWKEGNYIFEFYYDGKIIGKKEFKVY